MIGLRVGLGCPAWGARDRGRQPEPAQQRPIPGRTVCIMLAACHCGGSYTGPSRRHMSPAPAGSAWPRAAESMPLARACSAAADVGMAHPLCRPACRLPPPRSAPPPPAVPAVQEPRRRRRTAREPGCAAVPPRAAHAVPGAALQGGLRAAGGPLGGLRRRHAGAGGAPGAAVNPRSTRVRQRQHPLRFAAPHPLLHRPPRSTASARYPTATCPHRHPLLCIPPLDIRPAPPPSASSASCSPAGMHHLTPCRRLARPLQPSPSFSRLPRQRTLSTHTAIGAAEMAGCRLLPSRTTVRTRWTKVAVAAAGLVRCGGMLGGTCMHVHAASGAHSYIAWSHLGACRRWVEGQDECGASSQAPARLRACRRQQCCWRFQKCCIAATITRSCRSAARRRCRPCGRPFGACRAVGRKQTSAQ